MNCYDVTHDSHDNYMYHKKNNIILPIETNSILYINRKIVRVDNYKNNKRIYVQI